MKTAREMRIDKQKVKDASKEVLVTITRNDVKAGALKNATSCAAAQALVRSGVCEEARVHVNRTYLKRGNAWIRYKTPPALRSEVIAFDRGGTFEPGDYKLLPVPLTDRNNARRARTNNTNRTGQLPKRHPDKPKRKQHITTGVRQRFNFGGKIV